ncbi:protease inhibitor I42 family protein [Chloroflexota bacterium]
MSDQTVLQQTEHEFISPKAKGDKPPVPGAAGKEVWTFKVFEEGVSIISMEYSRPWEGVEGAEWRFRLTVVAK